MAQPKGHVDATYLQVTATLLEPAKHRTYELMHVQAGHRVLDVGCGPGIDTIPLAERVGPSGQVVGVDHDPAMIAAADQRAEQAGVGARVTHRRADATALPFDAATFDACRSERLFQHLPNPDQALAEMIRVTKAGGWVVVLDTDRGTASIDSDEIDIERRLGRFFAEHRTHQGYSGRQLYRRFRRHHLVDIVIEMVPVYLTDYGLCRYIFRLDDTEREALAAGWLTPDELARWQRSLEQAAAEGSFFASFSMVLVAGHT